MLTTEWQINLTGSSDQVKLFYISTCYDRPVIKLLTKCHRVQIKHEGQCEKAELKFVRELTNPSMKWSLAPMASGVASSLVLSYSDKTFVNYILDPP